MVFGFISTVSSKFKVKNSGGSGNLLTDGDDTSCTSISSPDISIETETTMLITWIRIVGEHAGNLKRREFHSLNVLETESLTEET